MQKRTIQVQSKARESLMARLFLVLFVSPLATRLITACEDNYDAQLSQEKQGYINSFKSFKQMKDTEGSPTFINIKGIESSRGKNKKKFVWQCGRRRQEMLMWK